MLRVLNRLFLILPVFLLALGCADDTKYQDTFRGKWKLENRTLPNGEKLVPPSVNGHYEWYPTGQATAHVTASFSSDPNRIQLSGFTYTLEAQRFSRTEYLRIGGGYNLAYQPIQETPNKTSQGQVSTTGGKTTLENGSGTRQTYEGTAMIVTFSDGTVDTWTRFADQLGSLPK